MTTTIEPEVSEPQITAPKTRRVRTIVRWAARITSVPIFGLLLMSLVPALGSFAISAKDDRIIALGMCAAALGFVVAWRWPGIGGATAVLGVGAILSQADGSIFSDPFSIAFGLQAVLFLISWVLNSPTNNAGAPRVGWVKRAVACLLVGAAVAGAAAIYRGPGPTPVPKEKEAYAGVWENGTGFKLEITPDGRAKIRQDKDAKVEPCNTPLTSAGRGDFLIIFPTDDRLQLSSDLLHEPKLYHIDRRPFSERKATKMILNGSDPYNVRSGIVLVKQQSPDAKAATR